MRLCELVLSGGREIYVGEIGRERGGIVCGAYVRPQGEVRLQDLYVALIIYDTAAGRLMRPLRSRSSWLTQEDLSAIEERIGYFLEHLDGKGRGWIG